MADREKVIKGLQNLRDAIAFDYIRETDHAVETLDNALALLKEQDNCENCAIAIEDRQPIVRCKDCKWWHESETYKGYGDCGQANGITLKSSGWFCADGKRKEGL